MKLVLRAWCAVTLLLGLFASESPAAVVINEIMYHPASEKVTEEFIELFNNSPTNANLTGWKFSKGVQFTFPSLTLAASNYLIVAADVAGFTNKYPGITNVVGGWTGRLSNSRNDLDLDDASSNRVDSVVYTDEGDWAVRQRTPLDHNHRGWTWYAEADGFDKSLELINPNLSNNYGQNWAPSAGTNGTPGAANSVLQTNIAPLILDVQHLPVIPRSIDPVLVTARLLDERTTNLSATLYWRHADTNFAFGSQPMFDDGLHNDGAAKDGLFAATIPSQTNNAVIEFYIAAIDQEAHLRTWPAPAIETNGVSLGQAANLLYQVDDSTYGGVFPLYKLIMREADRAELAVIGTVSADTDSDAEMNGTFISVDGTGTDMHYLAGFRNRGHGSRNKKPNNYRVAFTADRPWKNTTALNLNGQFTHAQLIGSILSLKAGLGGANSRPAQVRVNNLNLGVNSPVSPASGSVMFGAIYVANEAINSDWAEHWYPADSSGNIYRAIRDISPSGFSDRGTNYLAYTNTWFKQSNTSENDWTDLIAMLQVMGTNGVYTSATAQNVIHAEQWLTYCAVMTLFNNRETSPNTGHNDDYFFYAGANDRRFHFMYYDLDTIIGEGGTFGVTNGTLFGAASNGAPINLTPFLHSPEYEPAYYRTLQRLLNTTFSKNEFDSTLDQTLTDFVPAAVITRLKSWMDGRRAYVQSLVTPYLATNPAPPVATVSGEPRSPAPFRSATLTVGGANVTQYRYRLNNGAFGITNPVATPIALTNLSQGSTNTVYVIGATVGGLWQADTNATVSKTWIVNTNVPAVRINEVLARNVAVSNHFGTLPDLIELYNEGSTTVNLSGLRLTDTITSPNKYTFPNGTTLAAGHHLVLFANNTDGTSGTHLGFALSEDGEGVFLFDKATNSNALFDSVQFGLQLPDLAVGRIGAVGEFVLTQPTFGTNNIAKALADPHSVRINEWLASEFAFSGPDFIELYNTNSLPVALGGLYFTDNPISEPTKHAIAPLSFIGPAGFRVFKADADLSQGLDHLSFKLPAEQGLIALLAQDLSIIDCVPYGPQGTDISQGRMPDGSSGIIFLSTPTPGAANPSATVCTSTTTNLALMAFTNVWKFNQTNNLDGVNWTATNYNDSAWLSGRGLLAFENNSAIIPLTNTVLADPRIAPPGMTSGHGYYFRSYLNVPTDLTGFTVNATTYLDDGAVIYINGNELNPRIRIAAGVVTNRTFATDTPNSGDADPPDTFTIPASMFVIGTNVIAVEVHQNQTNSSDIVWGMALTASMQTTVCGLTTLVLNEVLANNQSLTNAAGRTPDWVELYNTGTNTVDLSDMSLSDTTGVPRKWIFPTNTSIPPGGYLVVEFDDGAAVSGTNTGFGLNSSGDAVYLFRRPADGGTVLDSVVFGLQAPDFSIGRIPNGSGDWALALPTRGTANVGAGLGSQSLLKINEWLAALSDGDDWLELYNPNTQPVELSGLSLTDNSSQRGKSPIPPLSFLGPEGYQKFIADGNQGNGADHANFNLNSTSGFIGLYFWPLGTQIDAVAYGLQNAGVSQGLFPDGTANIISFTNTASPGAPNYLLLSSLVINELLSHTDSPLEDAVEIRNVSSNAVNISGWYLSNTKDHLRKYLVPSNTVVASGGYVVFYEYQFGTNTSPAALTPFNFNSAHGDEVHLSQTNGGGGLTGYRARAGFGASANGVAFGRFITTAGEEFVAMSRRSFGMDTPSTLAQFRTNTGAANPYPLVGPLIFSEIQYRPTNSFNGDTNAAEFIELLNLSTNTVTLYDPAAFTNTWHLSGGIDFVFPTNTTLTAGRALMLVSFDPVADPTKLAWFRAAYQVATNVSVLGPWSGALANEGEDLQLLKPDPPQLPPHPDAGFVPYVLVEHVHYLPTSPWPTNGLTAGASLQRTIPANFGNEPLNWFAAAPSAGLPLNDSDSDGLPDYWELANGLNPNNATGNNGANGDPDGDGQTNAQEFLAGTRPNDASDYLRIVSLGVNTGLVNIQFRTAVGHSYTVLYNNTSPSGPWQKLVDVPIALNSALIEIIDQSPGPNRRFYRLVTPANP